MIANDSLHYFISSTWGGRGGELVYWGGERRGLMCFIIKYCCFVRKFYQEVLPCDDESDGQVGRVMLAAILALVELTDQYQHNYHPSVLSPSMTLHIWWSRTCWLQFSSSCSSPPPSPCPSHYSKRRRNTRSSCESAESLSGPVWPCLALSDILHFSLDNVKSDLSSYVQNINLVGTDNNGILLALPDKSRIPASWNISLVTNDQFNRATVANLMLIGAGKSELASLITDITGLPCRALSDFISVRHPAKVLMLNHLCLWQLLTLSNLNIFSRLSVVLSAKGRFPKSDHTTGESSE